MWILIIIEKLLSIIQIRIRLVIVLIVIVLIIRLSNAEHNTELSTIIARFLSRAIRSGSSKKESRAEPILAERYGKERSRASGVMTRRCVLEN